MSGDRPTDSPEGTYHSTIPDETPSTVAIVEAVAAVKDCEPTEINPLCDTVDPEAIAQLPRSSTGSLRIDFTVTGVEVTVYSDESLTVVPA